MFYDALIELYIMSQSKQEFENQVFTCRKDISGRFTPIRSFIGVLHERWKLRMMNTATAEMKNMLTVNEVTARIESDHCLVWLIMGLVCSVCKE